MPTTATRVIVNAATGQSYTETYEIPDPTPEELAAQAIRESQETFNRLSSAVQNHIDKTVQIFRYDNIGACSKYKDLVLDTTDPLYPIMSRYKEESNELLTWCAACWATVEVTLLSAEAGDIAIPTEEELIALLPPFDIE